MAMQRVLILMATYQGAPWVIEQIESILAQRGVEVCIDVADDRSADGTHELVVSTYLGDPRVRAFQWDAPSGTAGENFRRLIRRANVDGFDHVAFADQDDRWYPDKLSTAVQALRETGAQGYSAAVEAFEEDGRTRRLGQCPRTRAADFLFEGAGQGCTFVMTRPFFERVREQVTLHELEASRMHYHDWLVYLVARTFGDGTWFFDPRPCMAYRQHQSNELGARGGLASIERRLTQVRSWWFRRQVGAAIAFHVAMGGGGPCIDRFRRVFESPQSASRRLRLLAFVMRHGRRRYGDRLVLAVSALAGWL
jgi:rhamnosyltransferase